MDKIITMKKTFIKILILFSIVFLFVSCNDPIFFMVHEETPILKPFIAGSPTNFVILGDAMYVASGNKIFSYGKNTNRWFEYGKLGSRIGALAATNNSLYILYLLSDNDNGRIRNCNTGGDLVFPNGIPILFVQSIHASDDVLFICIRSNNKYIIYYIQDAPNSVGTINYIVELNSNLNGVASDNTYYYLCVNEGIFYFEKSQIKSSLADVQNLKILGENFDFTGIIELKNNYVAAITNEGILYEISNETIREAARFSDDRYSTGALALWYRDEKDTMPSLLLVGRKEIYYSTSSNYTNGYVEILLDHTEANPPGSSLPITSGRILGLSFIEPGRGGTPTSIVNYDRYISSLGKKLVNYFIQAPVSIDPHMTLFAATQKDGVWSYRDRGDGKGEQWNAEQ